MTEACINLELLSKSSSSPPSGQAQVFKPLAKLEAPNILGGRTKRPKLSRPSRPDLGWVMVSPGPLRSLTLAWERSGWTAAMVLLLIACRCEKMSSMEGLEVFGDVPCFWYRVTVGRHCCQTCWCSIKTVWPVTAKHYLDCNVPAVCECFWKRNDLKRQHYTLQKQRGALWPESLKIEPGKCVALGSGDRLVWELCGLMAGPRGKEDGVSVELVNHELRTFWLLDWGERPCENFVYLKLQMMVPHRRFQEVCSTKRVMPT